MSIVFDVRFFFTGKKKTPVCLCVCFILSSQPMHSCFACSLSLLCRSTAGMLQYWPERRAFVSKCAVMNLSPACAVAVLYLRLIPTSSAKTASSANAWFEIMNVRPWFKMDAPNCSKRYRTPKHKAVNFEHMTSQSLYTSGDISIRV